MRIAWQWLDGVHNSAKHKDNLRNSSFLWSATVVLSINVNQSTPQQLSVSPMQQNVGAMDWCLCLSTFHPGFPSQDGTRLAQIHEAVSAPFHPRIIGARLGLFIPFI